ncbi:MAG: hypothetical protein LBD41_04490 [Clostridiales Family XIII bacterium]|nr:hypothetical protein [Clostridiales Family XIII bacterium]
MLNFNNNQVSKNFTNDFVDVKNIYQGVIETSSAFIKTLELTPNNFLYKPLSEQEDIIDAYAKFLSIAPYKFRIKVTNTAYNIERLVNKIEEGIKDETNKNILDLALSEGQLIYNMTSSSAVRRRFFLSFAEQKQNILGVNDIDISSDNLNKKAFELSNFLGSSENFVIPKDNENNFLANMIYDYYNPKTSKHESFVDRYERIDNDYFFMNGDKYVPGMSSSYFAPKSLQITQNDYYIIDGMYRGHIYIPGSEFGNAYDTSFFSDLISMPQGVDIDIFFEKQDINTFRKKSLNKLKFSRVGRDNISESHINSDRLESKIESSRYLKQMLSTGQNPYYFGIVFTITKEHYDDFKDLKDSISQTFKSISVNVKPFLLQESLITKLAPSSISLDKDFLKTRRNIMEQDLSLLYPFSAFEMLHENGIIMGLNKSNSSLVMVDNFNTNLFSNANMVIVGQSGKGKTYTLSLMALRNRLKGRQVFVISPDKAHEFKRSCRAVDGELISISGASKTCINLLDICLSDIPEEEYYNDDEEEIYSILKEKISRIIPAFALLLPEMTKVDMKHIDLALIKTYNNFGITEDNNSIFLDPANKEKGLKPMPIISDFYKELKKELNYTHGEKPELLDIVEQFTVGTFSSFNGHTNVALDNPFTVFDLEKLKGTMLQFGMYVVLDVLWSLVKQDRTKVKSVFVDEGSRLIGAGANKMTAEFIWHMAKVIRAYAGSLVFATQDVKDFYALDGGYYGDAILSASPTKIVLGLEDDEVKLIKKVSSLTDSEAKKITKYKKGDCLLCTGTNHVPVIIKASPYEHDLITTDPKDIKRLKEQGVKI